MAPPPLTGRGARVRLRLSGVAFLVVIALLVALTVLLYQKAFTPVVKVTLRTDQIGNQLSAPADVKVRGLVVGQVRKVSSSGSGAVVELALEPDKTREIPANVTAQMVPKTLFGEKYVSLTLPAVPGRPIQAGQQILQDRSVSAVETEKVLSDIMPLLASLQPQKLSEALNAVSGALRGRGDEIGANLARTGVYLQQLNPQLPDIQADFKGLADLAQNVDQAAPDLLQTLDNLSFSSRSLVQQQQQLDTFLTLTTTASGSASSFLADNTNRLISLASSSTPSLGVLAKYSPNLPCLFSGLTAFDEQASDSFGGLQPGLHITLELTTDQGAYVQTDRPKYADTRDPNCFRLPKPVVPQGGTDFQDGYRDGGVSPAAADSPDVVELGSSAQGQRNTIDAVLAPVLGVHTDEVPDLAQLLFGPAARGKTVGLS